jgi:hypothetical protein
MHPETLDTSGYQTLKEQLFSTEKIAALFFCPQTERSDYLSQRRQRRDALKGSVTKAKMAFLSLWKSQNFR